jgi:ABC-type nitrate/sulfonate/bicarbonate transport system ATPase subunit
LSIITIRKTSFLSIDHTVAEVVTMASSVKLIETLEEDIEDSIEIVTSRVDSLLAHAKRSAIYIKRKGVSLIDILRIRGIELTTNSRKCRSTLQPPHTTIF